MGSPSEQGFGYTGLDTHSWRRELERRADKRSRNRQIQALLKDLRAFTGAPRLLRYVVMCAKDYHDCAPRRADDDAPCVTSSVSEKHRQHSPSPRSPRVRTLPWRWKSRHCYAACRLSASISRSQRTIWFQLAIVGDATYRLRHQSLLILLAKKVPEVATRCRPRSRSGVAVPRHFVTNFPTRKQFEFDRIVEQRKEVRYGDQLRGPF
jgi:hypothetical protein